MAQAYVAFLESQIALRGEQAAALQATVTKLLGQVADLQARVHQNSGNSDVGENAGGVAVLRKGWREPVPLLVLSQRLDVEEIAGAFGAVEGLRKPINIGRLMAAIDHHARDGTGLPDA
jgi:hypothetical protein